MSSTKLKYKVGDKIICRIDGKRILITEHEAPESLKTQSFEIIYIDDKYDSYGVIVDENMIGWLVSNYHIKILKVNEKFNGKRFYELTENNIIGLTPNENKKVKKK